MSTPIPQVPMIPYPNLAQLPPRASFNSMDQLYKELSTAYQTIHALNSKIEALALASGFSFPKEQN